LLGVRVQMHKLLDDDPAGVVLQVEQVPRVVDHMCPTSTEVWAVEVTHNLLALSPLGVLLIKDREERYRRVSGGGEAMLTKCGEGDVHHLHNGIVNLVPDDGSFQWCCGVKGYIHPDLAHIQAMGLKGMIAVVGDRPVVAELDESAQELSWKPQALSTHGTKTSILAEGAVRVVVHFHLKNGHENITNPKVISPQKVKTENCNKANNSKEKAKT
jgi:hypothetical protein